MTRFLPKKFTTSLPCLFAALSIGSYCDIAVAAEKELVDFSLAELLQVKISTASRLESKLEDVPSSSIVVSQAEIVRRGYRDLTEVIADLVGIDTSRAYGDTWITQYWRGVNQTGGTVLLMIDGNVLNHLYYDNTHILSGLFISSIKQLEVVFGPSAVAYGDNAFLGTINVITHHAGSLEQDHLSGLVSAGSNQRRTIDFFRGIKSGDWQLGLSYRQDQGNLDNSVNQNYEYTQESYLQDQRLWGDFVNAPHLGGQYDSPYNNRSMDVSLAYQKSQFRYQMFEVDTGYGNVYATDKVQNNGRWIRPDTTISLAHNWTLSQELSSRSQLRYRRSDVDPNSYFVEGFPFAGVEGGRLIDFSYWRSINRSMEINQDFKYRGDQWSAAFGLRASKKDLQKAYDITRGTNPFVVPTDLTDWRDYDFPQPPSQSTIADNRIKTEEASLYFLHQQSLSAPFNWGDSAILNLGGRYEHHSEFGEHPIFNVGYTLKDGHYAYKLSWGQAFQEPSPRLLYGGWTGVGSDPNLLPEESSTTELSWNYYSSVSQLTLALIEVATEQTITAFAGGANNEQGTRKIHSLDLSAKHKFAWQGFDFNSRLNYSHVFNVKPIERADTIEQSFQQNSTNGPTGEIAANKLLFGLDWQISDNWQLGFTHRYFSKRYTSALNPVAEIPSYQTSDLNLRWLNVLNTFDLSLTVTNLSNKQYFHTGVNDANAGITAGEFDQNGNWNGSLGFFNSMLPQPGRELSLSIQYGF
jgi:outer membrane receptor for ferrienterochelin and colicins